MRAKRYKRVVCADGFTMSVQAHDGSYCTLDGDNYLNVEVGFPSEREELLMPYAEEPARPADTVYPYVPVERVTNVIVKHGGMVEGEVPPGVIPIKTK